MKLVNGEPVAETAEELSEIDARAAGIVESKRVEEIVTLIQSQIWTEASGGKTDLAGIIVQLNRMATTLEIIAPAIDVSILAAEEVAYIADSLQMIGRVNQIRANGAAAIVAGTVPADVVL